LGFHITGKPAGTGDGGFDVQAERAETKQVICIQCKHQKEPLGTPEVAEELAKVAAKSFLEGATIVEHRFICTGGVRNKLRTQLRSASRRELATIAGDKLVNAEKGELLALRKRLEDGKYNPREIAETYVNSLESIIAWTFHEFDVILSKHWADILKIAERFFQIERVVKEHPRASFDRASYVSSHLNVRLAVEPRLSPSSLPSGIATSSAADPGPHNADTFKIVTDVSGLVALEQGDLAIMVGSGGAGKTEALRLTRARILQDRAESTLPIFFSLAQYTPGNLDRLIHQELDVIYGTWRSLPDQIVLLCDGLNECALTIVRSFLGELKPLLKRKQVACIIASRDATSRLRIVLPEAVYACVRVESMTPIGIQRLAEATLEDGSIAPFVHNYRSIADNSGSPLMWTPFAVRAALRIWRSGAQLPTSLGQMLEVLLRSRCERNTEQEREQLDSDVILLLSGALAFQCLVAEGKLECPGVEAGEWIQAARDRCHGALGIADVREQEIIDLLIAHDLLRRAESGYFGFEHQLIAGALAAPLLAKEWRKHVQSLKDQVADDAWVFAARLVSSDDLHAYLDTLMNVDIVLAARATRDLTSESRDYVLTKLKKCIDANEFESLRISGLFALAALGSTEATDQLRIVANDDTSDVHYAARIALATTGDPAFLKELLEYVEVLSATPIHFSGGNTSLWQAAPLPKRLDVARQRLSECSPGDNVGESLMLISFERDKGDESLIERHLSAAKDLKAWGIALHALNAISPDRARTAVQHELSGDYTPVSRARLFRTAFFAGVNIDVHAACQCALSDETPPNTHPTESYAITQLITDVISKLPIPQSVVDIVARDLPHVGGSRRDHLWEMALNCKSPLIANYAAHCIETWNNEVYAACTFFSRHLDLARQRRPSLIATCEAGLGKEKVWWSRKVCAALTMIAKLDFSDKSRVLLHLILDRFHRVREAIESKDVSSLHPEESAIVNETLSSDYLSKLAMDAEGFLPIIALVHKELPAESLTGLLRFEFYSSTAPQELRKALLDCSDTDIDMALMEIREPMTLAKSLAAVCPRGATFARIELLEQLLRANYGAPAILKQLSDAIESCWCNAVLDMMVRVVSSITNWTDHEVQFFWDIAKLVGRKVTKEDESTIDAAIAIAQSAHAMRLLEAWRLEASQQRIGLARLLASE